MKNIIPASLMLACFAATIQPCFASTNDSDVASDLSTTAVLAPLAVSECVCELTDDAVSGTGRKLVKLVDATGNAIGDLTVKALDVEGKILDDSDAPRAIVDRKEIPLIVRKDYVEMSEPVQQK